MSQLTKKSKPFVWTRVCKQSFQELKKKLLIAPVLTVLDVMGNLVVYSETSIKGLGYMVM